MNVMCEGSGEETVLVCFKILYWHLQEGLRKIMGNISQHSPCVSRYYIAVCWRE